MKIHIEKIEKNKMLRVLFVLCGVAMNVCTAFLAVWFKLPFYFDTAGTILVTALGGTFLGIITAVGTNVLCNFFSPGALYYLLINILIAICTAAFIRWKKFERKRNMLSFILFCAFMGGILGTVFQWILYGGPEFGMVQKTAWTLTQGKEPLYFLTAVLLNCGINFFDKAFAAGFAVFILHFIKEESQVKAWNSGWRQRPLSEEEIKDFGKKRGRWSLKRRMSSMVILSSLSMAVIVSFSGLSLYFHNLRIEYKQNAQKAAKLASQVISADMVEEYVNSGEKISSYDGEGYRNTNLLLSSIKKSITGIRYVYVYQVREDGCYVVFDSDEKAQKKGVLGERLPFDQDFEKFVPKLLGGERIDVIEVDDRYGFFMTAYEPIYDSGGHCVAYAGADASFDYMEGYMKEFVLRVILVFSGFFVLILAYGLWFSESFLVYPINSMAVYADGFIKAGTDQKALDENVRRIRSLDIRTGDEVELLYQTLCRMAANTAEQMRALRNYSDVTAQMQTGLINTMADLVENRDSDTGAHVQKTAAYVKIILEGLKKKGYYPEKLTPKFMSDVVMSAPLHDVGKINIPDAVLNKPGKLTDEEYEIMKTHTTAGKKIMEKAISTVNGESYLKEARNMAAYHHERWDGKGYPEGLHGEMIPLSARIMAVADVFDALASPRVYKPAFPFGKALEIIREGAGTQFDPKCVEVFMDSIVEVKEVLKKYQEE